MIVVCVAYIVTVVAQCRVLVTEGITVIRSPSVLTVGTSCVVTLFVAGIYSLLKHLSSVLAGVVRLTAMRILIIVIDIIVVSCLLEPQLVLSEPLPVTLLILHIGLPTLLLQNLLPLLLDLLPVVPSLIVLAIPLLPHLLLLLAADLLAPLAPGVLIISICILLGPRRLILPGPGRSVLIPPALLVCHLLNASSLLLSLLLLKTSIGFNLSLTIYMLLFGLLAALLYDLLLLGLPALDILTTLLELLLLGTLSLGIALMHFRCTLQTPLAVLLSGLTLKHLLLTSLLSLLLSGLLSLLGLLSPGLSLLGPLLICSSRRRGTLCFIRPFAFFFTFRSLFVLLPARALSVCVTYEEHCDRSRRQ